MINENHINETEAENSEVEAIEALEKALAEEKVKVETNLAGWQRAQADFTNYRRHSEQEKKEIIGFANAAMIWSLLPILDDFERATNSFPTQLTRVKSGWADGIKLIERKLRANLEAQGLSHIKTVGEPFDPNLHEAVKQDKGKEGIVMQEIIKGYKLHDKVLRPAKVVVGNGEEPMDSRRSEEERNKEDKPWLKQ
ncbi:MAG: nucleotide exchange factor GrpE [Dehalococcoidales bacterium]|jgi:molecular chaperone GrpE|nr:nucleotide exchange factor GrpE [Dehalococcoidales bacterium]MDP7109756.1 nucleotide exchange factor GrpE [Dehalococcoidales bacterium]MDP7310132.1 nucleotide exchange factor GrpE [Dehalococcoidales bacterium]MDP7409654.1 nucleotide exchange factor GrpE [Dehalococcoidales bacterium]MDP7675988.1 nucleotide exchange factor GrpE [Dehalococcoidales bacterium]|tara:strand:+ start:1967 stop:2554 length:588 start_codon:yes stop_codon:yes gene_type:complete